MDGLKDLDQTDRLTLRTWRGANLLGWWFAGAVTYNVLVMVLIRTLLQKFAYETVSELQLVSFALAFGFSAATAGWLVGSRVYRSPALIGALAVGLPEGVLLVVLVAFHSPVEYLVLSLYVVVPALVASFTARLVWKRRPRALRSAC
jgi:hypothetical protein